MNFIVYIIFTISCISSYYDTEFVYYHNFRNLVVSDDETTNCLAKFKIRYRWVQQLETYLDTLAEQYIYFSIVS